MVVIRNLIIFAKTLFENIKNHKKTMVFLYQLVCCLYFIEYFKFFPIIIGFNN